MKLALLTPVLLNIPMFRSNFNSKENALRKSAGANRSAKRQAISGQQRTTETALRKTLAKLNTEIYF